VYTTCPECGTVFRIALAQLRAAEGYVRCGSCAATFNAVLSLTDQAPDTAGLEPAAGASPSLAAAAVAAPAPAAAEAPPQAAAASPASPASPAQAGSPAAGPPPPPAAAAPVPTIAEAAVAAVADRASATAPPQDFLAIEPDDAGELAIPDEFGPESWDDTLDIPARVTAFAPTGTEPDPDEDADAQFDDDDDGDDHDDATDDGDEDDDLSRPEELSGVVEYADWESLLSDVGDEDAENGEPVYVVEEGPPPALADDHPAAASTPPREPGLTAKGAPRPEPGEAESAGLADDIRPFALYQSAGDAPDAALPPLGSLGEDDTDGTEEDDRTPASNAVWIEDDDVHPDTIAPAGHTATDAAPAPGADPDDTPPLWRDRLDWPPEQPAEAPARRGWAYGLGGLALALALAAQVVTHQRDQLATHPTWGGMVTNLYGRLGLAVYPAWDLGSYEVRGSEAVAGRATQGALEILARIAVVGREPVGLPLIRVTLRDRRGDVLGQRAFAPADFLPAGTNLVEPLAPGTLIPVQVTLADPGLDASGYEVDVCLMTRQQGLVCQAEREPFKPR
jgi:predicted Zn finger-like uncharacterized protein